MEKDGYKPRTRKVVLEILKPLYKFALINSIVKDDPTKFINVKIPPQKKIVIDAANKLVKVYEAIAKIFKNDPYYQALFLFGFTGRRKNEVLSLQWEHIDLINGYYWLPNTKPNQQQKYSLPNRIKELLNGVFEWCGREESNLHALRHQILSLACLPVPPRPQTKMVRPPGFEPEIALKKRQLLVVFSN